MTRPKHPEISVQLAGTANAVALMTKVIRALREAGAGDEVNEFMQEALSADYENVLATIARWVYVT